MLDARPICQFEGPEAGRSYCYKPSYGQPCLVAVGQTTPRTPAGHRQHQPGSTAANLQGRLSRQVHRTRRRSACPVRRFARGDCQAAVAAGLEVPPEVRRQYPALFVTIPERFANGHHSAVERVTQALTPPFRKEPINVKDVDRMDSNEAHKQISSLRCERTRTVALNPDTAQDYDRYIVGHRADIDFYRWLRKLVDVGGVFHLQQDSLLALDKPRK